MKKLLFILVLAFSQLAWAQNIYAKENAPIIVVEGKQTYLYYTAFFTNNIESINVYKGQKAIDLFGEKAKIGALEIKFKPNTKLLNLDDFYKEADDHAGHKDMRDSQRDQEAGFYARVMKIRQV